MVVMLKNFLVSVLLALIATFAWFSITDLIIHMWLLQPEYQATESYWRSYEDMQAYNHLLWLYALPIIAAIMLMYRFGLRGWQAGLVMTLVSIGEHMVAYAVQARPDTLQLGWYFFNAFQYIGGAVVYDEIRKIFIRRNLQAASGVLD